MDKQQFAKEDPHNLEAEKNVVSSMVQSEDAIMEVLDLLNSGDFYSAEYGLVFDVIKDMYNNRKPVDVITLQNELVELQKQQQADPKVSAQEKNKYANVGKTEFLKSFIIDSADPMMLSSYAKIVKEKSLRRKIISICRKAANESLNEEENSSVLDELTKNVFDLSLSGATSDFKCAKDILIEKVFPQIKESATHPGAITGVPSGITDLDKLTGGFQPSNLIILAARPGFGKTSLALNFALYAAKQKKNVAFFSFEMGEEEVTKRLLSMEADVEHKNIVRGDLNQELWDAVIDSMGNFPGGFYISEKGDSVTVESILNQCRKLKNEGKLDIVMIDYLQLMGSKTSGVKSDNQRVSEISRGLKLMAKDLKVPVLCLSQLSRAIEKDNTQNTKGGQARRKPMLSDLRDSGSIEQDADMVLFIHVYPDEAGEVNSNCQRELMVAKNRHGEIKNIPLTWKPGTMRFLNSEKSPYGVKTD